MERELRKRLRRYVDGKDSLAQLRDWTASNKADLLASDDPNTRPLAGALFGTLWTLDDGYGDEAWLREEIASALAEAPASRQ